MKILQALPTWSSWHLLSIVPSHLLQIYQVLSASEPLVKLCQLPACLPHVIHLNEDCSALQTHLKPDLLVEGFTCLSPDLPKAGGWEELARKGVVIRSKRRGAGGAPPAGGGSQGRSEGQRVRVRVPTWYTLMASAGP